MHRPVYMNYLKNIALHYRHASVFPALIPPNYFRKFWIFYHFASHFRSPCPLIFILDLRFYIRKYSAILFCSVFFLNVRCSNLNGFEFEFEFQLYERITEFSVYIFVSSMYAMAKFSDVLNLFRSMWPSLISEMVEMKINRSQRCETMANVFEINRKCAQEYIQAAYTQFDQTSVSLSGHDMQNRNCYRCRNKLNCVYYKHLNTLTNTRWPLAWVQNVALMN